MMRLDKILLHRYFLHLYSACSSDVHDEMALAENFVCDADVAAGDGVHSQYVLTEAVEHAYAAHVACTVVDKPTAAFMVQQVACECASRGGNGVDYLWCSGGEQNGGDGFGGERHLETVYAVARRSGGSALRICSNCIFFQGVACVRNEGLAFEVLQGERFDLSVGGEVRQIEVHILGVLFGAVHEDDCKRIALVAYGTVGGYQRVVAGS